jgi:hypothetical protein
MLKMKKVLTILIATVLLASGMHVTIDHHYCCGMLADIKISVTGKMASCGMEQSELSCPFHPVIDKKCCEDLVSCFSITSNYYPEYFRLVNPTSERNVIPAHKDNWISGISYNPELINCVFPPGDTFNSRLTQSGICVFRI